MAQSLSPVTRIWNLLREQKSDIVAIYIYAVLSGLIQLSLPLGIQSIIGFVLGGWLSASLTVLIAVLVAGVLFAGIMQINQMKIIEKIQQKIFVKYAYAFADRIPKLDLEKIDAFYLPELVNRFFDTVSLQKSISKLLLDLPIATIQIVFGLILLSFYHPFFIVFGILLVLILWLILYLTGSRGLESSLIESKNKYGLVAWFEEMARLIKSFKFSSGTGLHLKKADEKTIGYLNARTSHFGVLLLQYKTLVIFKVMITGGLLIAGVILLLDQQINIGQFVAAEIIILIVINSVEKIIINLDSVYDVLTAVEKISKLTDKPVEQLGNYQVDDDTDISIEGQNLNFGYTADKQVIRNVSFKIGPGEIACITGKDGSGKSTLLKLLTGVYKEFSGSLLINNIPISNYNLASLRERTGIYFPHENIFNGTLWENITMGKPDIDKNHINYLVGKTGLSTFLASLPLGYDTLLDPTGKRLSNNVTKKILLVRALAHKPKLLLMEEPWTGVEEHYRNDIQQLLLQSKESTVIIAANDASFANKCHQSIHLGIS